MAIRKMIFVPLGVAVIVAMIAVGATSSRAGHRTAQRPKNARPAGSSTELKAQAATISTGRHYTGARMRLELPPAAAVAPIARDQALRIANDYGVPTGSENKTPEVVLTLFSNDSSGDIQPDGSVKLTTQNLLAWAVIWHEILFPAGDLRPNPTGPRFEVKADYVTIVDASSGKVMYTFNDFDPR